MQSEERRNKEGAMLYSVAFSHAPKDCPAMDKKQMEGLTQLLSPASLEGRGIRLVEGYVDKL
jgi:hypothetical protein